MFNSLQHPPLIVCMFNLFHLDYLLFLEHLHCIVTLIVLGLDKVDSSKRPSTKGTLKGKICESVFALGLARLDFLDRAIRWVDKVADRRAS